MILNKIQEGCSEEEAKAKTLVKFNETEEQQNPNWQPPTVLSDADEMGRTAEEILDHERFSTEAGQPLRNAYDSAFVETRANDLVAEAERRFNLVAEAQGEISKQIEAEAEDAFEKMYQENLN